MREQLAFYAERSRSAGLQRAHAELQRELIDLAGAGEPTPAAPLAPGRRQRLYRGRPVHVEEEASAADESDAAPTRGVIYRGSVA